MCLRLWVTSSCIIILIHQQWNRLHHKAAKSVLWLGFWILFWEVINYDVQKILTSRLVKIETWTIWTYSILLLTKMSYFCTIESVIKNVTDQKQTSKIFMLFILIWHHPSPELMTGLPHLTMICFRGHQWWIVSTCPLLQCQVACSRCLQHWWSVIQSCSVVILSLLCSSGSDIVCAPAVSMISPTAVSPLMQCWEDIIWRLLKLAPSWTLTPECDWGTHCGGAQAALLILFILGHGTAAPGSPPGTKHELQLRIRG